MCACVRGFICVVRAPVCASVFSHTSIVDVYVYIIPIKNSMFKHVWLYNLLNLLQIHYMFKITNQIRQTGKFMSTDRFFENIDYMNT